MPPGNSLNYPLLSILNYPLVSAKRCPFPSFFQSESLSLLSDEETKGRRSLLTCRSVGAAFNRTGHRLQGCKFQHANFILRSSCLHISFLPLEQGNLLMKVDTGWNFLITDSFFSLKTVPQFSSAELPCPATIPSSSNEQMTRTGQSEESLILWPHFISSLARLVKGRPGIFAGVSLFLGVAKRIDFRFKASSGHHCHFVGRAWQWS